MDLQQRTEHQDSIAVWVRIKRERESSSSSRRESLHPSFFIFARGKEEAVDAEAAALWDVARPRFLEFAKQILAESS
jgi:hypothetical protein